MKFLSIAAIAAMTLPGASPALATPQAHAKITKTQARTIALKAAPGKIAEAEYEKEDGGWRYSFDIRQGKRIHEIGVDAATGKIVEDSYEAPGDKD